MTGEEAIKALLNATEMLQQGARMIPGGDRELDTAVRELTRAVLRACKRYAFVGLGRRPGDIDERLLRVGGRELP